MCVVHRRRNSGKKNRPISSDQRNGRWGWPPGSVLVDLAAGRRRAGNCELTRAGEKKKWKGRKRRDHQSAPSTWPAPFPITPSPDCYAQKRRHFFFLYMIKRERQAFRSISRDEIVSRNAFLTPGVEKLVSSSRLARNLQAAGAWLPNLKGRHGLPAEFYFQFCLLVHPIRNFLGIELDFKRVSPLLHTPLMSFDENALPDAIVVVRRHHHRREALRRGSPPCSAWSLSPLPSATWFGGFVITDPHAQHVQDPARRRKKS